MIATAGLMSTPFTPLFFKLDFILFAGAYFLYIYGLFLS